MLKKLEQKGLVLLERDENDRRSVAAKAAQAAMELRDRAVEVPGKVGACLSLEMEEVMMLHKTGLESNLKPVSFVPATPKPACPFCAILRALCRCILQTPD